MLSEGVSDIIPAREVRSLNSAKYFLYGSLPLSKRNQLIVCCLCLVDGSEVDRENFKEFFDVGYLNPSLSSQRYAKYVSFHLRASLSVRKERMNAIFASSEV